MLCLAGEETSCLALCKGELWQVGLQKDCGLWKKWLLCFQITSWNAANNNIYGAASISKLLPFLSTSGMDEIQKSLSLDTCFSTSLQFHFLTASFTSRHMHKWCIFSHMPPADVYTHTYTYVYTHSITHTHSAVGMHLSPIIAFFVSLSQLADSYRAKHNSLTLLRYWRTKLELPYNYVLSQSKVKSLDISEVQWHKNDVLAGVHYIVFSEPGRSMRSCIMN